MNITAPFYVEDWIEVEMDLPKEKIVMVTERKSKYKHKVTVPTDMNGDLEATMRTWCKDTFGEGGRNKHLRWRYGWTNKHSTFYFKNDGDVSLFLLRWA
jgi:hypothetical protein